MEFEGVVYKLYKWFMFSKKSKAISKRCTFLYGYFNLKRKSYDIDGMLKLLFDSLNGYAYKDDEQIVDLRIRKHRNQSEDKLIIKIEEV